MEILTLDAGYQHQICKYTEVFAMCKYVIQYTIKIVGVKVQVFKICKNVIKIL